MTRNTYTKRQGVVRHEFLLGKSGQGKTEAILSKVAKQARRGEGWAFIGAKPADKTETIINADCHKWLHDKSDGAYYEKQNLFYVAAARPRDHLTISVVQNDPEKDNVTVFVHPILLAASSQSVGTPLSGTDGLDAPSQQEPLNV